MTMGNRRRVMGYGAVMALVMAFGATGSLGQDADPPLVSRTQYDACSTSCPTGAGGGRTTRWARST